MPNFVFYGSNNKILFLLLNFDMEFNFRRVLPIFDKVGRQDSCCQICLPTLDQLSAKILANMLTDTWPTDD